MFYERMILLLGGLRVRCRRPGQRRKVALVVGHSGRDYREHRRTQALGGVPHSSLRVSVLRSTLAVPLRWRIASLGRLS
jgi:hypothetical protein